MERYLKALGIKFIIVTIVVMSLFGIFYELSFTKLLSISLLMTGVSYVVGDLIIYPRVGNFWATLIDSVVYFATIWLVSYILLGVSFPLTIAVLAATYFLTIAEPLFHTYMKERVYQVEDEDLIDEFPLGDFQMETSEEIDDQKTREHDENDQRDK